MDDSLQERARARKAMRDESSKAVVDHQFSTESIAKLKQRRREQLKERPSSEDLDPYDDLSPFESANYSDNKTSKIFDIEGDGVLMHIPSSKRINPLSSLFDDNLFLSGNEHEYIDLAFTHGKGDIYSLVHFWTHERVNLKDSLNSATTFITKLLAWVCGTNSLSVSNELPRIIESLNVGLYMPVVPPKACALASHGTLRASERFLYEAATGFVDISLRAVFSSSSDEHLGTRHADIIKSRLCNMYSGEGSLQIGTDPLEHYNRRPPLSHSAEHDSLRKECSHLEFYVRQPGFDRTAMYGNKAANAELRLLLSRIALYDHPLFSPEDRLYAQLRLLYGEYHRHLKSQTHNYLKNRLQMLLHTTKKYQASVQADATTVIKLCADCVKTLSLLAAEVRTTCQLAEALYTTWNQLKGLRQHQNFISTPAKLVAINVHHTRQSTYTTTTASIKELLDAFEIDIRWIASHAHRGLPTKLNHDSICYLFKKHRRLLMSTSEFVLKLYTTAELTYDDDKTLPIQEVMRRRRVRQQRLYVNLAANERQITSMQSRTIDWPAFTIQLEQPLRLRVSKRPIRFEMKLWQRRLMVDLHLTTLFIPVPGMSACHDTSTIHSLAPSTEWIQFASSCIKWDVNFVVGDDVEVFFDSHRSFYGFSGQAQKQKDGTWIPGVVTSVRWRNYDINSQNQLCRAIPPSRLRRSGAVFEVRQRQLTGAVLISLQWVTNDTRLNSNFWVNSRLKPQSCDGLVEMLTLPPRPNKPDHNLNNHLCSSLINSSLDTYFPSSSYMMGGTNVHATLLDQFDPYDPRCTSLVNRGTWANACETAKISYVYRTYEARSRLAFRAVQGAGASRQLRITSSPLRNPRTLGCGSMPPLRHRLLRLRTNHPKLFSEPIPATDQAATADMWLNDRLASEVRRCRRALSQTNIEDSKIVLNLETVQAKEKNNNRILAFVQRVQDCVAERSRTLNDTQLPLSALVSEGTPLPQLRARGLVDAALEFTARRRRALRPPRQRRSAIVSLTSECSLLVQVISAYRAPCYRKQSPEVNNQTALGQKISSNNGVAKATDAGSFVSATFQEHRRRTMLAMGRTPRWKEILDLPFIAPLGDFSPTNLLRVSDSLRLSLFLERTVASTQIPLYTRNGDVVDEDVYFRRIFLGDLEIPFTTLYCNGGTEGLLEGIFQLRTPIVHISSDDLYQGRFASFVEADEDRGDVMQKDAVTTCVYIHLAIFLRPPLSAPTKLPLIHSSLEEEGLICYGINWVQQLRLYLENICDVVKHPVDGRIPKRVIEVFGNNMQGDAVLICRFLRPQQPPSGIDTFNRAARFVGLIPFLDDWQSFGCANLDVWCTSQEFLDIGAGDWEEHGILLHNFMLWLQLNNEKLGSIFNELQLVVGSGVPEGNTVYVMQVCRNSILNGDNILLWNACTGIAFHSADKRCPLVDIGCVITPENIYANVQGVTALHLLSYDFSDSEVWRPFFANGSYKVLACGGRCACVCNPGPVQMSRPGHLTSIQEPRLRYDNPDIFHAEEIQNRLAEEIKVR